MKRKIEITLYSFLISFVFVYAGYFIYLAIDNAIKVFKSEKELRELEKEKLRLEIIIFEKSINE